jgi:hypothetical protein
MKLIAPLVLVATQGACMTMRPVESPSSFLAGKSPGVVVVIANDGKATEIATPKLLADTVYGFNAEGDEVTFAVNNVQTMIAKQISVPKTILVAAGATVLTAFLATAVFGSGTDTVGDRGPGDDLDDFRARQRPRSSARVPLIRIGIPF